jgi:hypothetical protein
MAVLENRPGVASQAPAAEACGSVRHWELPRTLSTQRLPVIHHAVRLASDFMGSQRFFVHVMWALPLNVRVCAQLRRHAQR